MKFRIFIMVYYLWCIFLLSIPWLFFYHKSAANKDIIAALSQFAKDNERIKAITGDISTVKLSIKSVFSERSSHFYVFRVSGDSGRDYFRIEYNPDNYEVDRITRRVGFDNKEIVWPKEQAESVDILIPSHVYDGLIFLAFSLFGFVMIQSFKNNGKLYRLWSISQARTWFENHKQKVIVHMAIINVIIAVIGVFCLMNFFTVF